MAKRSARHQRRSGESNTYRFFVPPEAIADGTVHLTEPALAHQLGNVLRLGPGSHVTLLDNSGWEYTVVLEAVDRHAVSGHVEGRRPAPGEPKLKLALYVALLKGERFEWVLQKGTELGISVFVPVVAERSVVDGAAEVGAAKIERWERIIREAAEQSRRGKLPALRPAERFEPACEDATRRSRTLLLWEGSGAASLRVALREALPRETESTLSLFSGPEGGWSEAEIATAIGYNISLVSLGARILRAETAPLAAAAAIFYESGDLDPREG